MSEYRKKIRPTECYLTIVRRTLARQCDSWIVKRISRWVVSSISDSWFLTIEPGWSPRTLYVRMSSLCRKSCGVFAVHFMSPSKVMDFPVRFVSIRMDGNPDIIRYVFVCYPMLRGNRRRSFAFHFRASFDPFHINHLVPLSALFLIIEAMEDRSAWSGARKRQNQDRYALVVHGRAMVC